MAKRDASFDRKLENLLVQRLNEGQAAETLLTELSTRLDPTEADALLSRAEARARASSKAIDRTGRVLAGLAYGWTALLVLQNIVVFTSALQGLGGASPDERDVVIPLLTLALAKIIWLGAGVIAFQHWRSLPATTFYVLAILFAFPLGMFVQDWLLGARSQDVRFLVTVSALCSYAAALFAAIVYLRSRENARRPIAVEHFN